MRFSVLQQRIITGISLFLILIFLLYIGKFAITIALFVISLLALTELYSMLKVQRNPFMWGLSIIITGLIFLFAYTNNAYLMLISSIYIVIAPMMLFLLLWGILSVRIPIEQYTHISFALMYIPFLLQFALLFSVQEQIFVILITTTSDIGAYFGGKYFGKTLLWKRVSPNKTVEGAIAGLFLCTFLGLIYGSVYLNYSIWLLLLISIKLNIVSQLGDFFESGLKRVCNVKDSGKILPGHGGILDRIDSLLFVIPSYYIIKIFFI